MLSSFCVISNIFNGTWNYLQTTTANQHNPYTECPKFVSTVLNETELSDHYRKYSCIEKPYLTAVFSPNYCTLMPLKASLKQIISHSKHSNKKQILYVGDSLIAQTFVSLSCFLESNFVLPVLPISKHPTNKLKSFTVNNPSTLNITLRSDAFLRPDIPCDARCIGNETFRSFKAHGLLHPCFSCNKGVRRNFSNFERDAEWLNLIPHEDTLAIVIGTGAWYNMFQGLYDANKDYEQLLHKIGPIFSSLKTRHGIHTYWMSLPPHDFPRMYNLSIENANKTMYGFEWIHFAAKDRLAREILVPHGVNYIDVAALTTERKVHDLKCTSDSLHWCNPGPYSVPTAINQVIFHLLAVELMKGKKNVKTTES